MSSVIAARSPAAARHMAGLSLIELMVTLVISSIVIIGLVTLVNAIGVANRTQDGLARLQENGRFAMQRIAADLRAASAQHCSNFDSAASSVIGPPPDVFVDTARAAFSYFNAATNPSLRLGPTGFGAPYLLSPRFMMVGHECAIGACTPALNAANRGVNLLGAAIPNMGSAAGQRAQGADVLTVRYLTGEGVRVVNQREWQAGGGRPVIDVVNDPAELARAGFAGMTANSPIWVSDCGLSEMFLGTIVAPPPAPPPGVVSIEMTPANFTSDRMRRLDVVNNARAYHLPTALRTVSYYLQIANDNRTPGRRISVLMRKEGANVAQGLVEGIERFDLLYGVEDSRGRTRYLTAAQVDALGALSQDCPPNPANIQPAPAPSQNEPGCGWRAVKSIEVYLLANTVEDVSSTNDDEFRYSWFNDGTPNNAGQFENPQALGATRNGLPAGRMLRREFRTLVNLRGYNY